MSHTQEEWLLLLLACKGCCAKCAVQSVLCKVHAKGAVRSVLVLGVEVVEVCAKDAVKESGCLANMLLCRWT